MRKKYPAQHFEKHSFRTLSTVSWPHCASIISVFSLRHAHISHFSSTQLSLKTIFVIAQCSSNLTLLPFASGLRIRLPYIEKNMGLLSSAQRSFNLTLLPFASGLRIRLPYVGKSMGLLSGTSLFHFFFFKRKLLRLWKIPVVFEALTVRKKAFLCGIKVSRRIWFSSKAQWNNKFSYQA